LRASAHLIVQGRPAFITYAESEAIGKIGKGSTG